MNPKLLRGSLDAIIIQLLDKNGEMYGYELVKKAREISDDSIKITEGALYPMLHKLEAKGVLDVETRQVGNRFRKYYKLSEQGTKESVRIVEEMQEYLATMQHIFNLKPSI